MRKIRAILGVTLVVLALVWVLLNPPGRFGTASFFGVTTYSSIPWPAKDLEVSATGEHRLVPKTHRVQLSQLAWLLRDNPEVLVIAKGWQNAVVVNPEITTLSTPIVVVLSTGEALRAFNLYKKSGRRVAIHVHSTC